MSVLYNGFVKYLLAIQGSPRVRGNSTIMMNEFLRGATEQGYHCEIVDAHSLRLEYCRGCLRCNIIKRCAITSDDWQALSEKILRARTLVFASPVYFHHLSAAVKKILDRFRSFMHVRITETGLVHTLWQPWQKNIVILLSQGSPDTLDARPIIDLFEFIRHTMGPDSRLISVLATRLALSNQISMTSHELQRLYEKIKLDPSLAAEDSKRNRKTLKKCYRLGLSLDGGDVMKTHPE